MNDFFKFFLEADILKANESDGKRRIIQGYASSQSRDRQGESMVQKGLDISDFVNHGWLNYDHDNSTILGYPTKNTRIDSTGLWVEGELLKGVPMADKLWDLALALQKSNAPRKLGFSIEGKVLEKRGNTILKAKIYNCAITPNPVNVEANWEAVVKSFQPNVDILAMKSLEAGYADSPDTQQNGGALRKESLDYSVKTLAENLDNHNFWTKVRDNLANGGNCTTNDMIVYLQLSKGLSRTQASKILNKF